MATNPASLLSKSRTYYKTPSSLSAYKPTKFQDRYGYQYLIKGDAIPLQGAIHTERFLEENDFGRFGGASIVLSTGTQLECGDLISWNNELFAIDRQKSYTEKLKEYDYICLSVFDYYKDFIVDTQTQANRILGGNSMRYLLALDYSIPIIPSMFAPTLPQYISAEVMDTQNLGSAFVNQDNFIQQNKKDRIELTALGLDTNALLNFQNFLLESSNTPNLGVLNFPTWKNERRYNREFDLKANLEKMILEVSYSIIGTDTQADADLIKQVGIQISTGGYNGNTITRPVDCDINRPASK